MRAPRLSALGNRTCGENLEGKCPACRRNPYNKQDTTHEVSQASSSHSRCAVHPPVSRGTNLPYPLEVAPHRRVHTLHTRLPQPHFSEELQLWGSYHLARACLLNKRLGPASTACMQFLTSRPSAIPESYVAAILSPVCAAGTHGR